MKKTRKRLAFAALVIMAIISLGSCDFVLGFISPNEFTIDGATFETHKLYAINWGENTDGNFNLYLYMVPDTMSMDSNGVLTGEGDYAWFWINTSTPALGENSYSYNPTVGVYVSGTLYYGGAVLGFGTTNPTLYYINGGILDVTQATVGDDFVLDFYGGSLSGGGQLEARFRGTLELPVITASSASTRQVRPAE